MVKNRKKRVGYIVNCATLNAKMTFWSKNINNRSFIKNLRTLNKCAFVHCNIGTRRLIATSYKTYKERDSSKTVLTLKKSSFLLRLLNTYIFTKITEWWTNCYAFSLSRIRITRLDSTIYKRKGSAYPIQSEKEHFFYHKSQKYSYLT